MCGINGIFQFKNNQENLSERVQMMNQKLGHRGPDDAGVFSIPQIAMGQQRLSIIDLSNDGHQPFVSHDGRYVIVFNGELYNYKELRSKLYYPFRTNTDTEVLLASFIEKGADCLTDFNGMFAFAVWDNQTETLFVARDRLGIKPLYYYKNEYSFIFSSEIRAILASDIVPRKLNKKVLSEYLQYQTVHCPNTIVDGVKMLEPGCFVQIHKGEIESKDYWNLGEKNEFEGYNNKNVIQKEINERLHRSIERRIISDVPFGAFLSGGIDSSIIVGLMSEVATHPVETFSVTFDEREFTEAKYSKMVADHFKTNHHEIQLSVTDFIDELPNALASMDHPSGDGPNSYVVSKATKNAGITVALSGLGGDELFAGYSIFKQAFSIGQMGYLNAIPRTLRLMMGKGITQVKKGVAGEKIKELLSSEEVTPTTIYPTFRKALTDMQLEVLFGERKQNTLDLSSLKLNQFSKEILKQISIFEIGTYMQNVLLRDTDQMSMANALEVRVPFLDHELVEYVLSVPDQFKYPVTPKSLLVDSVRGLVPNEIIDRPKMGFVLPWKEWLKTELRDFCESRLNSFEQRQLTVKGEVLRLWNSFLVNDPLVSWSRIWHIVVLEDWMQRNEIES